MPRKRNFTILIVSGNHLRGKNETQIAAAIVAAAAATAHSAAKQNLGLQQRGLCRLAGIDFSFEKKSRRLENFRVGSVLIKCIYGRTFILA